MYTMTMPPITYSNVAIDASYNEDKYSVRELPIENITNITNKQRETYYIIVSEIEKIIGNKVYPTCSISNNTVCEAIKNIYYCSKRKLEINNQIYLFDNEFIYIIKFQDDMYIAENDFLNIWGYGNTITEAENDLFENIDALWNVYAEEDDSNLDEGAQLLKKTLLNNIRKLD